MKITFHCDNNANIHSERADEFSPEDLGITEEQWRSYSEDEKNELVKEWALERFEYWFTEYESVSKCPNQK